MVGGGCGGSGGSGFRLISGGVGVAEGSEWRVVQGLEVLWLVLCGAGATDIGLAGSGSGAKIAVATTCLSLSPLSALLHNQGVGAGLAAAGSRPVESWSSPPEKRLNP